MKCPTHKKNCPLQDPKNLLIAGICAAAALVALGGDITAFVLHRRIKARLEPIIFQPPIPAQPADTENKEEEVQD